MTTDYDEFIAGNARREIATSVMMMKRRSGELARAAA